MLLVNFIAIFNFTSISFYVTDRYEVDVCVKSNGRPFSPADLRETGFVNAITSAGLMHAITSGCSRGHIIDCNCGE